MHAHQLAALRRLLHYSAAEAGRWIAADPPDRPRGVEERTWNRWEAGARPVPPNIAARVLQLVAWRAAELQRLRALAAAHPPGAALALPWYDDRDDWPGDGAHWRPYQSAVAALLAELGPGALVLQPAPGQAPRQAVAPPPPPGMGIPAPTPTGYGNTTSRALQLEIPAGLGFADLKLARDSHDGSVSFDIAAVQRLCAANNLDPALFLARHEDAVAGLIVAWYKAHRANGGAPDAVAEALLAEVRLENERGGGLSHPPGRA